jgi:hypothetical protein
LEPRAERGFVRKGAKKDVNLWTHPGLGIDIYDAVPSNVLTDKEGVLHFIDVDVIPVNGTWADVLDRIKAAKEAAAAKEAKKRASSRPPLANLTLGELEHLQSASPQFFPPGGVSIGLSAATDSGELPGVKALTLRARGGDKQAASLLHYIAKDSLNYLTSGMTGVRVETDDVLGVYGGSQEPALNLQVRFNEATDRREMLAVLARFAENFNQHQVHVSQESESVTLGQTFDDGSFGTVVYEWEVNDVADALSKVQDAGLDGVTVSGNTLTTYYARDPNDQQRIDAFLNATRRFKTLLGDSGRAISERTRRLWIYGQGEAAIEYGRIRGDLRPGPARAENRTAQRLAAAHKGAGVNVTSQARTLTPRQQALQTRIAGTYGAMRDNALDDPTVRQAYEELVEELVEQFDALPVKVTTKPWTEEDREPYKNSREMRDDVLGRNHLWVLRTDGKSFGPERNEKGKKTGRSVHMCRTELAAWTRFVFFVQCRDQHALSVRKALPCDVSAGKGADAGGTFADLAEFVRGGCVWWVRWR